MASKQKLTTVVHGFYVETLRQVQIGLPFESLRGKQKRRVGFVETTQWQILLYPTCLVVRPDSNMRLENRSAYQAAVTIQKLRERCSDAQLHRESKQIATKRFEIITKVKTKRQWSFWADTWKRNSFFVFFPCVCFWLNTQQKCAGNQHVPIKRNTTHLINN